MTKYRDLDCRRCVCVHQECLMTKADTCADFVNKPEMSRERFLEVCALEEEMLLTAFTDSRLTSCPKVGRSCFRDTGLPLERCEAAFKRLLKYKYIVRVKNYYKGYRFEFTTKGAEAQVKALAKVGK